MLVPSRAAVQMQYQNSESRGRGRTANSLQAVGTKVFADYGYPTEQSFVSERYHSPLRAGLALDQLKNPLAHSSVSAEYQLRRKTPGGTLEAAYDAAGTGSNIHAAKHQIVSPSPLSFYARDFAGQVPGLPIRDTGLNEHGHFQQPEHTRTPGLYHQAQQATIQQIPQLIGGTGQPFNETPFLHLQQETSTAPINYVVRGRNDQYMPNVAQPPMQTPFAQQYGPALSNLPYGFHDPGIHKSQRSWALDPHSPSFLRAGNPVHNAPAFDAHCNQKSMEFVTSSGLLKRNPDPKEMRPSDYNKVGMQSFAERASKLYSANLPLPHQFQLPPQSEAVNGAVYQPHSSGSRLLPPETVQQALFHSYGSYASLMAAIQDAAKTVNPSLVSQSRHNLQPTHIYPEPTRKHYYKQDFSHNPSFLSFSTAQTAPLKHLQQGRSIPGSYLGESFDILSDSRVKLHRNGYCSDLGSSLESTHPISRQILPAKGISGRRTGCPANLPATNDNIQLVSNARNSLEYLTTLISESESPWLDGMQLAGSLAFLLEDYECSRNWFSQIIKQEPSHTEATCNLGVVMIACGRRQEAEHFWRLTLKIQPDYFDAAEQLVTLLCHDHRHKEAVTIVEYMQQSLKIATNADATAHSKSETEPHGESCSYNEQLKNRADFESSRLPETNDTESLTSSQIQPEYSVQSSEIGRMMTLIHAKGNIKYTLQDQSGAEQAFEEVVLLATGVRRGGLMALIELIQSKLSGNRPLGPGGSREPLLLSPEKALLTSKLCFGARGGLPGLKGIFNSAYRKSATSCTSNSLLSLAKICQDGISSLSERPAKIQRTSIHDILVLYYLSLSLQPSPSTANNVGILLANVQQTSSVSKTHAQTGKDEWFMFPGVAKGSGVALALTYYQYGLSLDSKHAHLFTNLGSLLKDIGQLQLAIKMYEKAVACDGNFDIALANLANAVKDQGKTAEAITYYKRAVQVNPNFAEAVCGLANALNSICDWAGRGGVLINGGNLDRWHVDAYGSLQDAKAVKARSTGWIQRVCEIVESQLVTGESWGHGLLRSGYVEMILSHLVKAKLLPDSPNTYLHHPLRHLLNSWHHAKWEGARLVRTVERATKRIGWKWYQDRWVNGREEPISSYRRPQTPSSLPIPTAPTVLPFHTFTFPVTAKQVRLISQRNALRVSCTMLRSPWLPCTVFAPPPPPRPHLNVGYISSDFNNHPLAHLMQSVFGMHDRYRVKAFCYATTPSDKSAYRKKIESEAPVFYDASGWSIEEVTQRIVKDEIHVLVNLNGYTRGARNEVFAARPAPIQMSFMGFAGSLGAEWCDYLLSDEVAVPPRTLRPWRRNVDLEDLSRDETSGGNNENWVYSENIIYTRDTFFCCDHRQSSSSGVLRNMTWDEERARRWAMRKELFPDISDDSIIFGNFNQLYKIDPTTFRTWLRILLHVKNSILWLLRFPDVGEQHLRATAIAWAGPAVASRIVFTNVAPKAVHIARACVADLFLDTPECNAHTTAADCLWSGTPILTLPRYEWKMCSRMAAGILGGALPRHTAEGLDAWNELVVSSEEEYEATAIRLGIGLRYPIGQGSTNGHGAGRLMDLRKMLWEHRWESKLFDTRRWVSDLELAYEEAWRRWVAGEGGDIWLKDLTA